MCVNATTWHYLQVAAPCHFQSYMAEISLNSKSYITPHCWIYAILEFLYSLWPVQYCYSSACCCTTLQPCIKRNIQKPPPHSQHVVNYQPVIYSYPCYHLFIDLSRALTFLYCITLGTTHYCNFCPLWSLHMNIHFMQLHFTVLNTPWKEPQEVTEKKIALSWLTLNHYHFETFLAVCIGTRKGQMQLKSGDYLDSEYENKETFRIIASNTIASKQLNVFFRSVGFV